MKRILRHPWWLITCLLLSLNWLTPTVSAETYGAEGHDYTIDITPTITDNSITLDYKVNIPDGKTVNGGYTISAWLVGATGGKNPESLSTQTGKLVLSELHPNTQYTIFLTAYIYTGTEEGTQLIALEGDKALHLTTTGNSTPTVSYKAVLGASTIGARTITIPYQFFMVKDGQDIAITDDNRGDITMKVYFAWAGNDTEQEKKALSAPAGAFVCDGLSPATAYNLYPKFFVNGQAVEPTDRNFTLTTLEETTPVEPAVTYTLSVQEYTADGSAKIGDAIALDWTAPFYAFRGETGHYYAIHATPSDGGADLVFGAQPDTGNNLLTGNVNRTDLSNPGWSFKFDTEGTLFIYTEGDAENAKPVAYKFDAVGGGQTTSDGSFTITGWRQIDGNGDTATMEFDYEYKAPTDKQVNDIIIGVVANSVLEEHKEIWIFLDKTADPGTLVGTLHLGAQAPAKGTTRITLTNLAAVTQTVWAKGRFDFADGEEDIKDLGNATWTVTISPNSGTVITKPTGAQSLEQLGAVNTFSGKVEGGELNSDGTDLVYIFPSYCTDTDNLANGMSGHYTKSTPVNNSGEGSFEKYHWTPDLFYTIGNDAQGHIVGIINYPTPIPDGFVPQIKINNNLWLQFQNNDNGLVYLDAEGNQVAEGTAGAKEHRQFYFSTAYKQDILTGLSPWFEPVTYVNDATVSFFFRAPMYGQGEHQTRTYTYKTANSERTTSKTVEEVSKELGSDAIAIYTVDALPDNVAGPSDVSGGWDHTAHPTDFASGQQDNGQWGVGYDDEAIYWHPAFQYALGNNAELAGTEGSPITMVVKFDEGTIIPADMKAYFNVFVLNDKGEKLNPETLEPQWDAAPVASGTMASDPDEVNLYYGSTGENRYSTDGMTLGVEFRFEYTSIIRYEGYSNTLLRSYAVSEDPGISSAVKEVAAEGNDITAPVEYYNLQGMKVANPQGGIFIRRQGNTVTKVLVK